MFWALGTMLVNAYVLYVQFNFLKGRKKRDLLSHHDFRREIALYWINPEYKGTVEGAHQVRMKALNRNGGVSVMSEVTIDSSICSTPRKKRKGQDDSDTIVKKKKSTKVTASTIAPNGHYYMRLDTTADHFPTRATDSARCALHRWAQIETTKEVMHCATCNISLCLLCYRQFHFDANLHKKQSHLIKTFAKKSGK